MSYELTWVVPERVIEMAFLESFDEDSAQAFEHDINAMLDKGRRPVHIMIDMRSMDKETTSIGGSMKRSYYRHPNMGSFIIIGLNKKPVLRFISTLVARGAGIQFKNFDSREQALAYLASVEHL
jgi:hypothetical protein